MLHFFRKHQKILFFIVTFAVIVSFCFFGAYGTMAQPEKAPDREIGKGLSGKPIKSHEFTTLCHLLESSVFDRSPKEGTPNLLNPGVIEKEFLSTGLGLMLVKPYFAELKKDLDGRVKKIHYFRSYVHPKAPQVSAEWAWEAFSAPLIERYRLLKSRSDQATAESFALMSQLYLDQLALPPSSTLKQILLMQQAQAGVESDPLLEQADLSLFGFKSIEDWFGPQFVPLVAGFILNAAQVAEEKGYQIKIDEVRTSLFQNIYQGYRQFTRNGQMSPEEANHYYVSKMRSLNLDEKSLLDVWKKVLLFSRFFEDVSSSILIDPLVYEQFDAYANNSLDVDLYKLPESLQFPDFLSMLKFQLYIEAIGVEETALRKSAALPSRFLTLDQLEKKAPQLVEGLAHLEWRSVTKAELESGLSIKETLSWELIDANWALLKKNFAFLNHQDLSSESERIALLNRLDPEQRSKVDAFARNALISAHPERLSQALQAAPLKKGVLGLRTGADFQSVLGLNENGDLLNLLKTASLKGEEPNESALRLSCYSADQNQFYAIDVVSKEDNRTVLTFAQASKDGTLERILMQTLEKAYPDVRKKHPSLFHTVSGEWRPLDTVKELVAKYVFADLLKGIEESYLTQRRSLPESTPSLDFYASARLYSVMEDAKRRFQLSPQQCPSLLSTTADPSNASEWLLEKESKVVTRSSQLPFRKEELFSLNPHECSSVQMGKRGFLAFCLVKGSAESKKLPLESVEQGHQILSQDAKKDLMAQLVQQLHKEKGMDLLSYLKAESP